MVAGDRPVCGGQRVHGGAPSRGGRGADTGRSLVAAAYDAGGHRGPRVLHLRRAMRRSPQSHRATETQRKPKTKEGKRSRRRQRARRKSVVAGDRPVCGGQRAHGGSHPAAGEALTPGGDSWLRRMAPVDIGATSSTSYYCGEAGQLASRWWLGEAFYSTMVACQTRWLTTTSTMTAPTNAMK